MMKKLIDTYLKSLDEDGEVVKKQEIIWKEMNNIISSNSKYSLEDVRKIDDGNNEFHYIIHISGGDNGKGSWVSYLNELTNVIQQLELKMKFNVYIIKLENDCLDDIHNVFLGLSK
jgi:hypothetical protein